MFVGELHPRTNKMMRPDLFPVKEMDLRGIEPRAFSMRKRRSTADLQAQNEQCPL